MAAVASAAQPSLDELIKRTQIAELEISKLEQRFTDKYGTPQKDLLKKLNLLKKSLIKDQSLIDARREEIIRNNIMIVELYSHLLSLRKELIRSSAATTTLTGEDFRVMMKQYFVNLRFDCLFLGNDLEIDELFDRRYAPKYKYSTPELRNIRNLFVRDMRYGLNKNLYKRSQSSLKMLSSNLYRVPTGNEDGVGYALDWGGSNFRILRLKFNGNPHNLHIDENKPVLKISSKYMKCNDKNLLFDYLALNVRDFMVNNHRDDVTSRNCVIDNLGNIIIAKSKSSNNDDVRFPIGFTFSFPMKQPSAEQGILIEWTKGFDVPGVVGNDVAKLMQNSFNKYNIPVRISAVTNDTVGTLLSAAFDKTNARVGLILGTGTNAAYIEPKKQNQIINTEWGAFNKGLNRIVETDIAMDPYTPNPGKQYAEKIISGYYLGELVRLLSIQIFGLNITRYMDSALNNRWGLGSPTVSTILRHFDTQSFTQIVNILRDDFGLQHFNIKESKLFAQICRVIVNRSADLTAALLLGVLEKTGMYQKISNTNDQFILKEPYKKKKALGGYVTVGIDGSVWSRVPRYQQRMRQSMRKIVGKAIADRIKLTTSTDGSGKGSILAVLCKSPPNNNKKKTS